MRGGLISYSQICESEGGTGLPKLVNRLMESASCHCSIRTFGLGKIRSRMSIQAIYENERVRFCITVSVSLVLEVRCTLLDSEDILTGPYSTKHRHHSVTSGLATILSLDTR